MILKITEKDKSNFNKSANHPLQSWEWGEFRKAWGNEVVWTRWGLLTLHKIPFTKYKIGMFIKGPKPTQKMLDDLKTVAKENNLLFIKLEPAEPLVIARRETTKQSQLIKDRHASLAMTTKYKSVIKLLKENGCTPGKTLFTPTSFWLDLTKSENELMKGFSSKTRYNIRLAQKKGVKVVENNSDSAFEKYIELTRETIKRQGFYAHTEKYHRLMWQALHKEMVKDKKEPIARLLTASYKGQIITTWIVLVWHQFLYYPYGASSVKHRNVMANNLMLWEVIRYGKKLSLKTFDLWGREPGKGFTKFKEGYNPQVVEFLGTWDLITSPLYYPYRILEYLRWKILRVKGKFINPKF